MLGRPKPLVIGIPSKKPSFVTTYISNYPEYPLPSPHVSPKKSQISPPKEPSSLGLGDDITSTYKHAHVHLGDAYKHRTLPEFRAKQSQLGAARDRDEGGDWSTSYQDIGTNDGKLDQLNESPTKGRARLQTAGPLGLEDDGKTVYKQTFRQPQASNCFAETVRVKKKNVEHPHGTEVSVDPYGPLCKSLVHESFKTPPQHAYLEPSKKKGLRNYTRAEHNSIDGARYGLGEFGTTVYQETFGRDGGALPAKTLITKSMVPLGEAASHKEYATSYKHAYAPPAAVYTGVGPNVLLHEQEARRARYEEGHGRGLGEDGRSSYQLFHGDRGDVYRARAEPHSGAQENHLDGAGARVRARGPRRAEWTTSYEAAVAAVGPDGLARIGGRPARAGPAHRSVEDGLAYGLGEDGVTVYRRAFGGPPRTSRGTRASREAVEGGLASEMERYGPLGRSMARLSWRAPPPEAYLERRAVAGWPKMVVPVGTLPPTRAYGLGEYGDSSYRADYTDPAAPPRRTPPDY